MKISKYTNIIRKQEYYLLHNTLYNTTLKIYDERTQFEYDELVEKEIFHFDSLMHYNKVYSNVI